MSGRLRLAPSTVIAFLMILGIASCDPCDPCKKSPPVTSANASADVASASPQGALAID